MGDHGYGTGGTTTGTTTGTSTSTSSSSSSAPSGPTQAQLQAMENARASFRELLRRWGLTASKNLLNLIEKATQNGWNTTIFLDRVRHTPEYAQKYPGIQWKDGMTEGAYLSEYNQYKNVAQQAGVNFSRDDFAKTLKRGVGPEEFTDRVTAIQSIDRWAPMWQYFSETLAARGLGPPKGLSKKQLADFVMKLGPKQWEKVYDETFLTAGLERVAGIQVGKDYVPGQTTPYSIGREDILNIVKQVEALSMGGFDPAKLDFAKIGEHLRQFKPEYLQRYDITTKDIVELELGGPRAATIAEKAQRVLKTQEAFYQPRATPTSSQGVGQQGEQKDLQLPQSM